MVGEKSSPSPTPSGATSTPSRTFGVLQRILYFGCLFGALYVVGRNIFAGYRIQMQIDRYAPGGPSRPLYQRVYDLDIQPNRPSMREAADNGQEEEGTQKQEEQRQQKHEAPQPPAAEADIVSNNQETNTNSGYPKKDQYGNPLYYPKDEEFIKPARSRADPLYDDSSLRSYWPQHRVAPIWNEYQAECAQHHPIGQHAIFTMASGDRAARMATALLQSILDVNKCHSIELNIMISSGGIGSEDCANKVIPDELRNECGAYNLTDPWGTVSKIFLDRWKEMGVKIHVVKPIATNSKYLKLPGGTRIFWGMAFNKLNLFRFTNYKKILWMDSDVLILKNVDHLLWYPEFTGAYTNDCCNRNSPAKLSGGFWVVEPSLARLEQIIDLVHSPSVLKSSIEEGDNWSGGDMSMVAALFTRGRNIGKNGFPFSIDPRQAGINEDPVNPENHWALQHAKASRDLQRSVDGRILLAGPEDITVTPLAPYRSEKLRFVTSAEDMNWGDEVGRQKKAMIGRTWHMLNASYDALPYECECIPSRDLGFENYFSVHLTCFRNVEKPPHHQTFADFWNKTTNEYPACLRPYFNAWAQSYKRGLGHRFHEDIWVTPREGFTKH